MQPTTALEFIVGMLTMAIIAGANMYAKKTGKHIGRAWLTGGLFILACVLAVIFQPPSVPAFPVYAGDPVAFTQALMVYLGALASIAATVTGFATVIYNTLVKRVLDQIDISARLSR